MSGRTGRDQDIFFAASKKYCVGFSFPASKNLKFHSARIHSLQSIQLINQIVSPDRLDQHHASLVCELVHPVQSWVQLSKHSRTGEVYRTENSVQHFVSIFRR